MIEVVFLNTNVESCCVMH